MLRKPAGVISSVSLVALCALYLASCVTVSPDLERQVGQQITKWLSDSLFGPMALHAAATNFYATHGRWPATEAELIAATPLEDEDGRPLFHSLAFEEEASGDLRVDFQTALGVEGAVYAAKPQPQTQPTGDRPPEKSN